MSEPPRASGAGIPPWATYGAALLVGASIGYPLARHLEPSAAHVIFVPATLLLGVVMGFVLGGRAARDALAAAQRAEVTKAERRAAREAARAADGDRPGA